MDSSNQTGRPVFPAPTRFVNDAYLHEAAVSRDRLAYQSATPGSHLVLDGLFDPQLLRSVSGEFPSHPSWAKVERADRELCFRSINNMPFGPAADSYFAAINSACFLCYLQALTGIDDLVADVTVQRGGLHETRSGGYFKVHRDFSYHRTNDLKVALIVVTYLNEDWRPEFRGDLELWNETGCARSIAPLFGRTVIMGSPDRTYHGHPDPLNVPPGMSRRSVAAYFYVNQHRTGAERDSTQFFDDIQPHSLRGMVRRIIPQSLRTAARAMRG
jgi:Rps23 Pro-64 3,4-dihydroxylase Tpa1-like proline 4-hydroxylase